jgi:hypothetical protein
MRSPVCILTISARGRFFFKKKKRKSFPESILTCSSREPYSPHTGNERPLEKSQLELRDDEDKKKEQKGGKLKRSIVFSQEKEGITPLRASSRRSYGADEEGMDKTKRKEKKNKKKRREKKKRKNIF